MYLVNYKSCTKRGFTTTGAVNEYAMLAKERRLRVSPLHCAIFFLISTYLCDSSHSTSASRSVQLIYAP